MDEETEALHTVAKVSFLTETLESGGSSRDGPLLSRLDLWSRLASLESSGVYVGDGMAVGQLFHVGAPVELLTRVGGDYRRQGQA